MRAEVALASLGLAVLAIANVVGLQLALVNAGERSRWVVQTHEVIEAVQAVARDATEAQSGFRGYLLSQDRAFLDQFSQGDALLDSELARASALVAYDPAQLDRLAQIRRFYDSWRDNSKQLIENPPVGGLSADQRRVVVAGKAHMDALRGAVDEMVSTEKRLLRERERDSLASSRRLDVISLFGTLLTVLVGGGGAILFARRVSRHLASFTSSAEAIAGGDLRQRVECDSRDELGLLARTFNRMAEQLEDRQREGALLKDLREMLHAAQSTADASQIICALAPRCLPGTAGRLFLIDPSRNLLQLAAGWGTGPLDAPFAPEACWSFRLGHPHLVVPARTGIGCEHRAEGAGVTACLPLMAQGEIAGLLHLAFEGETLPKLAIEVSETLALTVANLRLRETLKDQATRDPLTGLVNRRFLDETVPRELERATRARSSMAVVMMDLDHFKRVNDTYGHTVGDTVLREVAGVLQTGFRAADVVCRYGGEEFLALLVDCDLADALWRAEAVRAAVSALGLMHEGRALEPITISAGVAAFPRHGSDWAALLHAADDALYRSKRAGRDRVSAAGESELLLPGSATEPADGAVAPAGAKLTTA